MTALGSVLGAVALAGCAPLAAGPGGGSFLGEAFGTSADSAAETSSAGAARAAQALLSAGGAPAPRVAAPQVTQAAESAAAEAAWIDPSLKPVPAEFAATDEVTWDGVRTLRGIWLAHPGTAVARRVRLTNEATGKVVDGALFRRDPAAPGPRVQISADAAEALAMTPGQAATLSIVAIRPGGRSGMPAAEVGAVETAPEPVARSGTAEPAGEAVVDAAGTAPGTTAPRAVPDGTSRPETGAQTASQTASETAAADDVAGRPSTVETVAMVVRAPSFAAVGRDTAAPAGGDPSPVAPVSVEEPGLDADASSEAATTTASTPEPVSVSPPEPSASESQTAAQPAAGQGAPESGSDTADTEVARVDPARATAVDARPAAAPDTAADQAPGPDTASGVEEEAEAAAGTATGTATGIAENSDDASDTAGPVVAATGTATGPTAGPATGPTPQPTAQPVASGLDRPLIQIGIFGTSGNAERLVARLREEGLPVEGRPFTFRGRPAVRVVAGPFGNAEARRAALLRIRDVGPSDAYPVSD